MQPEAAPAALVSRSLRLLGARVIASAGSADKLRLARAEEATETINYCTDDLAERVGSFTNWRGVDAVLDCVGGAVFEASLEAVAWSGRLVAIGAMVERPCASI